ncbi:TonB-dependent receptor [Sphingomonas qomolangmaensis]|uniref:TonB-dependent receptor n=1 Tax=Sphingomonas qomolangmaensis TaxID=2918765 RepID=A0ABY5L8X3_9SPHN|nr:TonB-dependent receptor [Sphingomonas qomolangmaensis]UUL82200.1 TonB-dependent receptor [Sphingomonas qomolangmaensis]
MVSSSSGAALPAFLALSCVGALVSGPAYAADPVTDDRPQTRQERRDDPQRDDIVVTGLHEKDTLESPKATAPLLDTPQTITVISDQTLRKQNLLTLRDALQTVPGITFGAGEGGGGYGDSINLRGYSANNDITQDGVRDTAQYSRTDPFNLQQIEVYNGANTVFNGSGSVGGTINLVSKVPQARDLTIMSAGIGTDQYYRASVDSNVRVNDLVAVRLNAMVHRNDVPGRDVEQFERWGVAPSITIGIDGPTSLTLAYVHQQDDNVPIFGSPYYAAAGGVPEGIDDADYFGIANLDSQRSEVDRLTATFTHQLSDALTVRNLTRYQRVSQPTVTSAPQGTFCLSTGLTPLGVACPAGQNTPGLYYPSGPRGLVRDQLNDLLYNQTDLTLVSGTAGRLRNTLVVGASYAQEDYVLVTANLLRNPGGALPNPALPPIAIGDPSTDYTGPINRIVTGRSQGDSRSTAVYAFDTLEIGEMFEVNAGVRWEQMDAVFRADTYATPATGGAITRGTDQLSDENLFSYRGGVVFKPVPNASFYASYGNSKTPSSATVRLGCTTACDVAPETGESYEIGAKADLFGRRLQLTAAVFRNERTNFRVATNDPVAPSVQVLDGRSRVDGIALGASGNITPAWSIFANYTYLKGEILQSVSDFCLANPGAANCGNSAGLPDPQAGNVLIQTPDHSGSLFTTYTLPFGLQLGYGLTYQGSFALNQSSLAAPIQLEGEDFLTHRAFLSYAFAGGLTAQVNIQNLTNERYYTGIRNNGWATPGDARSAVLSVFYSF